MHLNWLAYQYRIFDGYGRFSAFLIQALRRQGVGVAHSYADAVNAPDWMCAEAGLDWGNLTISCLPPPFLTKAPGRHWLITMTEGSALPPDWADAINESGVERVIVPCQHNAEAFAQGGVTAPIHVIAGGTDPDEFPLIVDRPERPYTFLALADRGARKGWVEVWDAFYRAFGSPTDTPDVRLIIKSRPEGNEMLELIAKADNPDPRVTILMQDMDMREFYRMGDCFAIPSRSEGWGMPHREAAMMGLPVITQEYSGMDDGHTEEWAFVIDSGTLEPIPERFEHIAGEWLRADVDDLAFCMKECYTEPDGHAACGRESAQWLRDNQTWDHSAKALLDLIGEHN